MCLGFWAAAADRPGMLQGHNRSRTTQHRNKKRPIDYCDSYTLHKGYEPTHKCTVILSPPLEDKMSQAHF